jgi:hypothetical protein
VPDQILLWLAAPLRMARCSLPTSDIVAGGVMSSYGNRPGPCSGRSLSCGVRSLLLLVLILGVLMSWVVHQARVQSECIAIIGEEFALISYDRIWYPAWIRNNVGIDYFSSVVSVQMRPRKSDRALACIGRLSRLRKLTLYGPMVTDARLANLKGLVRLKWLTLEGANVSDSGLAHLSRMSSLEVLNLDHTRISDAGLVHLTGLTNLRLLFLRGTRVSDEGVRHIKSIFTQLDVCR